MPFLKRAMVKEGIDNLKLVNNYEDGRGADACSKFTTSNVNNDFTF